MKATEDILDIFSILHDGTISAWTGNTELLTLTVDCEYLAERIDKSFDKFYVELSNIDKIEFAPWTNPVQIPAVIIKSISNILRTELEIVSADIKDGDVVITCYQYDTDLAYSGGNLTISCQAIKVFDQNKNEMTIDQMGEICKNYWDELTKK